MDNKVANLLFKGWTKSMAPDSVPILVVLHPKIQMWIILVGVNILSTRQPREGNDHDAIGY